MRNIVFGTLLFSLGLLLGARADEAIIARVNGQSITVTELMEKAALLEGPAGEPLSEADREEAVSALIDNALLLDEALAQGLDRDPKVKMVMINALLRDAIYANVQDADFTEEALRTYFEANVAEFVVPEKVQIKRISVRYDTRSKAKARSLIKDIRAQIVADPERFSALAQEHSEGPYSRRGGDLGFIPRAGRSGVEPEVIEVAYSQEVGEVSKVFQTDGAYNIVLSAARREQVDRSFEQMRGSVLRKLKNAHMQQLLEEYVATLREGAAIEREETTLRSLDLRYSGAAP